MLATTPLKVGMRPEKPVYGGPRALVHATRTGVGVARERSNFSPKIPFPTTPSSGDTANQICAIGFLNVFDLGLCRYRTGCVAPICAYNVAGSIGNPHVALREFPRRCKL